MTGDNLTREQGEILRRQIATMLRYLVRLRRRMELRGFIPADRLYLAARRAEDVMQSLHVEMYYCQVREGVGRARK